jgi:hypothetical protein
MGRAGRAAARAVNDLSELLNATRQIAAQTRQRLSGVTHDGHGVLAHNLIKISTLAPDHHTDEDQHRPHPRHPFDAHSTNRPVSSRTR